MRCIPFPPHVSSIPEDLKGVSEGVQISGLFTWRGLLLLIESSIIIDYTSLLELKTKGHAVARLADCPRLLFILKEI